MNAQPLFKQSGRQRAAVVLLIAALVPDLVVGTYHLTHRGPGSGITELVFAGLLLGSIGAVFCTGPGRWRRAGLFTIGVIALVLFGLSIYHLTHDGLPSFIIELVTSGMLGLAIFLARSDRRG